MVQPNSSQNPGCVLAAIDMGPGSRRVLLHAAGLARLLSTGVKVLHVGADTSAERRQQVLEYCAVQGPYEVDLSDDDIVLGTGFVSEAIYREAARRKARLGRLTDQLTSNMLRERAHRAAVLPRATIVRHGDIAEQISRCAATERTGLVVMGLGAKAGRQPGAIASAILRANAAFVLAVPGVAS